jgi:hypothetical protein
MPDDLATVLEWARKRAPAEVRNAACRVLEPRPAATDEGLRELIRESFAPAMRIGLKDAELFDEPGAERVEEWITYITKWVADAVSPRLERLRAELAEARESAGLWKDGLTAAGEACGRQRQRAEKAEAAIELAALDSPETPGDAETEDRDG